MRLLYSLSIYFYLAVIRVASLFHPKAKLWVEGREKWQHNLTVWRNKNTGKLYWFHCASLGEFEQGRPLIEQMKSENPEIQILLTFFSPSGFEFRKNYPVADGVFYLPADTPSNAKHFLRIIKPDAAFIVKYEYWANLFHEAKALNIPIYMVSAILRPDQRFFGSMSFFWKKVLKCVTHFFVQNDETMHLLNKHGFKNATRTGDTRFDRVNSIFASAKAFEDVQRFKGQSKCVVGGSTWAPDEDMLASWMALHQNKGWKLILVPHEINEAHVSGLRKKFPSAMLWSERTSRPIENEKVLIVDTIGMLSSLYRYADIALIGGGFGAGIHNTLEAAVWGIPVLFGPKYQKFEEARELIAKGGGFGASDAAELLRILTDLASDEGKMKAAGEKAGKFVQENLGATRLIMSELNATRHE